MLEPQIAEDDREEFITRVEKLNREISSIDELENNMKSGIHFLRKSIRFILNSATESCILPRRIKIQRHQRSQWKYCGRYLSFRCWSLIWIIWILNAKKEIINKLENIYYGKK